MAFIEPSKNAEKALPQSEPENNDVELAGVLMRQKVDSFSSGLLGQFDASGSYSIPETIMKELAVMAKIATESNNDMFYLVAKAGTMGEEFVIKFILNIESDNELKTATLKVVERVDRANGILSSNLSTFVAKYTDEDNEFFTTKVFTIFNIISEGDDTQMLSLNDQFSPSIIQLKTRHRAMKVKLAGMVAVDKKFFEDRIAALKKGGSHGAFALRQFAILLKQNGGKLPLKSESKYYRIMNELIDNCLERAGVIKDPALKAALSKINATFRDAVQQAESTLSVPQVKKDQAKSITPAVLGGGGGGGGGKPGGGKPGGGGGKDSGGGGGGKGDAKLSMLGQYTQIPTFAKEPPKQPVQKQEPKVFTAKPSAPDIKPPQKMTAAEIFQRINNDFAKQSKAASMESVAATSSEYVGTVNQARISKRFAEPTPQVKPTEKSAQKGNEKSM